MTFGKHPVFWLVWVWLISRTIQCYFIPQWELWEIMFYIENAGRFCTKHKKAKQLWIAWLIYNVNLIRQKLNQIGYLLLMSVSLGFNRPPRAKNQLKTSRELSSSGCFSDVNLCMWNPPFFWISSENAFSAWHTGEVPILLVPPWLSSIKYAKVKSFLSVTIKGIKIM